MKTETLGRKKQGKREYLNYKKTRELLKKLELYLEENVGASRIKNGNKQAIETLIYEESLLLVKYFRNEKPKWTPRVTAI